MAKRADITEDKILTDYEDALQLAKVQAKPNVIIKAATAQAKLVGLLKRRMDTKNVNNPEDMEIIDDILQQVTDEAGADAAAALAKALGRGKTPKNS
jgi:hypothetical protein